MKDAAKDPAFVARFMAKVNVSDGCWLWQAAKDGGGYGRIMMSGKVRKTHRVSYEMHVGPIPPGLKVLHRCDIPGCVNPGHLFLGTQADNMVDMVKKGRRADTSGERGTNAKLTNQDVLNMRAERRAGTPNPDLAKKFGVTAGHAWRVTSGKLWRHLPDRAPA